MRNKKRAKILLLVLACMLLSACGQEKEEMMLTTRSMGIPIIGFLTVRRGIRLMLEEGLIEDQNFQVSLAPVGDVFFASYLPNTEEIPLADVSFSVIKNGWEITRLYGVYSENVRETEVFKISETLTAELSEKTISAVLDYLAATFPGENAG